MVKTIDTPIIMKIIFKPQEYLPDELKGNKFYKLGNNPIEQELQKYLKSLWKDKYGYLIFDCTIF